ncbi:hypothetical protein [Sagittula sp. S175]|uniref:hypothetical protein n=1 Tax=Sagittula sp. S175 TaxID=3415129 RepID=UPI003C7C904F
MRVRLSAPALSLLACLSLAGPVCAQVTAPDAAPEGCFITMIDLMAAVEPDAPDLPILAADLGPVPASGPRRMTLVAAWRGAGSYDFLECGGLAGLDTLCRPTGCKGGSALILHWDERTITLGTSDLTIGRDNCVTARNLAPEVGQTILYKLYKTDDSLCRR